MSPGSAIEPGALIAWCREEMANYKAPRRIELVDALPHTATGKVQKGRLRTMERRGLGLLE